MLWYAQAPQPNVLRAAIGSVTLRCFSGGFYHVSACAASGWHTVEASFARALLGVLLGKVTREDGDGLSNPAEGAPLLVVVNVESRVGCLLALGL